VSRPRFRLRTKVSLLLGFIALVAGLSVAAVSYTSTRASLLDSRADDAREIAINHASNVVGRLGAEQGELNRYVQALPSSRGFIVIVRDGEMYTAWPSQFADPSIFPAALRTAVSDGEAATQRFRHDDKPYVGVGIPLADGRFGYFEAFELGPTERTLQTNLLTFSIGSTLAVLVFGATGIWIVRRLLRPLETVTNAAREIAAGDLTTRVAAQRDADLVPLVDAFNGMADAVQARIEREGRFVSDVSHELRSPITALQAATDVLERRRDEFGERPRQAVDVIINQVRRFDGMVLDLLELSRLDAGASDLHVEQVELADACRRIGAQHGMADVPLDVDPAAPRDALIDRVRLERILGNLLENAKNHADGPTRIAIEPDADGDPGYVQVAVEDSGPGVEPDERERIFGRFARGQMSRHRIGTGLGLALVAENASAQGGRAWVEDAPGGGARFVVRLRAPTGEEGS